MSVVTVQKSYSHKTKVCLLVFVINYIYLINAWNMNMSNCVKHCFSTWLPCDHCVTGQVMASCEHGNQLYSFIKHCGPFD